MEEYGIYFMYFLLATFFLNTYIQAFLGIKKNNEERIEESKLSVAFFVIFVWGLLNTYNEFFQSYKMAIMIGVALMIVISIIGAIANKANKKLFLIHGITFVLLAFLLQFITPMVS